MSWFKSEFASLPLSSLEVDWNISECSLSISEDDKKFINRDFLIR